MRTVLLIGGDAHMTTHRVAPGLLAGDYFYVPAPIPPVTFDPNMVPGATRTELIYRLCTTHLDKDRVLFYATPLHWHEDDGLIALFGQPSYDGET